MESDSKRPFFRALEAAAGASAVGAITYLDLRLHVNDTTAALTFLLAILAMAARWGLAEATVASVVAVLSLNYFFLPPVGTFTIADPENWVALLAFLIVSIVASQLSASAKKRATEATRRRDEMERLYALSRSLLLVDPTKASLASQISYQIAQVFDIPAVAFFDRATDRVYAGGSGEVAIAAAKLRDAAIERTAFQDPATGTTVLPVHLGGAPTGSLAVAGAALSDTALHAIANLAAITIERARTQEIATRAEAARQNEELKSTLLDALAHEFKTPLTSIKAAVSSLLAGGDSLHEELLTIIEEETDRLDALVTETIQMARIEAGQVRLETQPRNVRELVAAALKKADRAIEDREVRTDLPDDLPEVIADGEMVGIVIRQLVSNSLKYADPGSPIEIRARGGEDCVVMSIADRGPGISEPEQARIFDRFYRIPADSGRLPGTGMGLAIARDIVEAHGGTLRVESKAGEGSTFWFTLPSVRPGVRS